MSLVQVALRDPSVALLAVLVAAPLLSSCGKKDEGVVTAAPAASESETMTVQSVTGAAAGGSKLPTANVVALPRLNLTQSAVLGQGHAFAPGSTRAAAVEVGTPATKQAQGVEYDLKYVEDFNEVSKHLNISLAASYNAGAAGGSARVNFMRSSVMSKSKAYVLVKMVLETHSESISAFHLNAAALQRIRTGDAQSFFNGHGDSFISGITYGGELYALMEFSATSAKQSESLRADVKAAAGNFGGNVSVEQKVSNLSTGRNVSVRYVQSGGGTGLPPVAPGASGAAPTAGLAPTIDTGGGVVVLNPEQLLYRLRQFPFEVRNNPKQAKPLYGELKDYSIVDNWPSGKPVPAPNLKATRLESVARVLRSLQDERETVDDVMRLGAYQSSVILNAASLRKPYLELVGTKMETVVTSVAANPVDEGKVYMESFAQYRSERQLEVPSDVWRGNAGAMCDVTEQDTARVLDCMFGREAGWRFENWPVVKSSSVQRGWYGEGDTRQPISGKSVNWHGTFHVPCSQQTQAFADNMCGKTGPDDGVFAFIETVPGTDFGGNRCGYHAVNVACVSFAKPARELAVALPVLVKTTPAPTLPAGTTAVFAAGKDGEMATFKVKATCAPFIGRYQLTWRAAANGPPVATTVGYWRSEAAELEASHPVPVRTPKVMAATVALADAYCEVPLNSAAAKQAVESRGLAPLLDGATVKKLEQLITPPVQVFR